MRKGVWSKMIRPLFVLILLFLFQIVTSTMAETQSNRLIHEKSPYLLQHAHNPVDWYPWGQEAFEKARKENKPIFLSVGYSTCHWCHVMEEESFENPQIAKILNENFVPIKVDREERPDVDQIYTQAVMALTGQGGWPMSVFLTPDLKPFYGGTYFPPEDRWGRPGFAAILRAIAMKWKEEQGALVQAGEELTQAIQEQAGRKPEAVYPVTEETLAKGFQQFASQYDSKYGGFGDAPKFPRSHALSFLLRYWKRWNNPKALEMVEETLKAMARGGMYDQLGGGFHRYSVDGQWRVPHFEKMLYDQALLAKTYLEAYQATHKEEYARIAREIFDYVIRDMKSPEGAFYSAEDADSPDPTNPQKKSEGAFFLWTEDEIAKILGHEEAQIFNRHFGVEPNGNALSDPQGELRGKNILYVARPDEKILPESKKKLFEIREKRPRPHLDDKILTDWNGLMISSLAFGASVLNESKYRDAARRAADFILANMKRKDGRLLHRYRDGEAAIPGFLEDYAFFIHGLIDLYEATFDSKYLDEAKFLSKEMIRLFWDEKSGGFLLAGNDGEKLISETKELYDGAIPSGNSVAALALLRVGRLAQDNELEKQARQAIEVFSAHLNQFPSGFPQMLIAVDFAVGPSREIVIEGDINAKETREMIQIINGRFLPNKVVLFRPSKDKAKVSICENYVCKLPVTEAIKLREALES